MQDDTRLYKYTNNTNQIEKKQSYSQKLIINKT